MTPSEILRAISKACDYPRDLPPWDDFTQRSIAASLDELSLQLVGARVVYTLVPAVGTDEVILHVRWPLSVDPETIRFNALDGSFTYNGSQVFMAQAVQQHNGNNQSRVDNWRKLALQFDAQRMIFRDYLRVITDRVVTDDPVMLDLIRQAREALASPLPSVTQTVNTVKEES